MFIAQSTHERKLLRKMHASHFLSSIGNIIELEGLLKVKLALMCHDLKALHFDIDLQGFCFCCSAKDIIRLLNFIEFEVYIGFISTDICSICDGFLTMSHHCGTSQLCAKRPRGRVLTGRYIKLAGSEQVEQHRK